MEQQVCPVETSPLETFHRGFLPQKVETLQLPCGGFPLFEVNVKLLKRRTKNPQWQIIQFHWFLCSKMNAICKLHLKALLWNFCSFSQVRILIFSTQTSNFMQKPDFCGQDLVWNNSDWFSLKWLMVLCIRQSNSAFALKYCPSALSSA